MTTGSHVYPIGFQLLWSFRLFMSIALCPGLCFGGYLALYYYFGKDAEFAAIVTFSMLAILAVRLCFPGIRAVFIKTLFNVPAYGFIDAEGIHYRHYVLMRFAPWRAIERLEYWPQDGGKIDVYLHENVWFAPIQFAPHPSWSQHTADELKSKPPAAIGYIREHLLPSAFQFGVAPAPNVQVKIIDYLVAVGLLLWFVSSRLLWQTKAWYWAGVVLLWLYLMVRIRWAKGRRTSSNRSFL